MHTPAARAEPDDRGPGDPGAATAAGERATELLDQPAHGRAALAGLGDDLSVAAARNGISAQQLRDLLLGDRTAWLSSRGTLFYKEPVPTEPTAGSADTERGAFPYAETFSLHSNPDSQRTIFLDFDGATVSGTWWNDEFPGMGTAHPAWSLDTDAATFSTVERDAIQLAWQIVAEDLAPFDVDVTTEDPGRAALERTASGDLAFGTRALISPSSSAQGAICPGGCGGIAFLGTFHVVGSAAAQPAWVFPHMLGDDAKAIAEAVTHEVGHNLGLQHDGHGADDYYLGHGAWAPIMGVGYYQPVTQWSIGEYAQATNTENDLAVIQAHGLARVVDDHAAKTSAATELGAGTAVAVSGVVSTRADVDAFAAELTCAGTLTATAQPDPLAPNLDIRLRLLDATGTQVASANPVSGSVDATTASGMSARISQSVPAGSYYLQVEGVGAGNPATTGYSDYGSLGAYTLKVAGCLTESAAPPPSQPTDLVPSAGVQQASVSWKAPTNAVAAEVSQYRVRVFQASAVEPLHTALVGAGTTAHAFTGLAPGTAHSFDVRAIGVAGEGALSARSAQVTPTAPPLVRPGKVQIGQAQPGAIGGSITATARWSRWTGSAVTGYKVTALRLDASGQVLSRTVSAMQAPTRSSLSMVLPRKGTYAFVVQAFNQTLAGPASARSNKVRGR
jgi:hypothetical protein